MRPRSNSVHVGSVVAYECFLLQLTHTDLQRVALEGIALLV